VKKTKIETNHDQNPLLKQLHNLYSKHTKQLAQIPNSCLFLLGDDLVTKFNQVTDLFYTSQNNPSNKMWFLDLSIRVIYDI
jgi:hypothetical protein